MHEYERRLLLAADWLAREPAILMTTISHDDGCGVYGGAECDCDPDITMTRDDGRVFQVDREGKVLELGQA